MTRELRLLLRLALALSLWLVGLAQAATYAFRSDSFAWESTSNSISWDGSCTNYPGDDDKATITLNGGFVFPFAGVNYGSVRVLTNGGLQFGSDTGFFREFSNTTLPAGPAGARSGCTAGPTTNALMAYWTDLDPSRTGSGQVTWQQKGVAPNRYLVVSWNNVYQYNTSTPYSFQIILYENGEFKYQYGNANASGSNATIGVQVSGSDYTLYAYKSGYNANGSAIRWFKPDGTPTRLAEYRMDESTYVGKVGEVVDSTGKGHDGTRLGGALSTATGYICRGFSIPANFDSSSSALDTSLPVASGIGNSGSVSFWYRSNITWNSGMAQLLDASAASSRPFFLARQGNGGLRFSVSDSAGSVISAVTGALSYAANSWQHVAVTWRVAAGSGQSTVRIYINGLQATAASGTTNGNLDPSLLTLFAGDNRSSATPSNSSVNSANGIFDEMRIYNYEISALELTDDMAVTHSCPPPLDHIEAVPSSTSALTCAPLTVTLKACSDAACTTLLSNYSGTVLLSTSTGRGDWGLGNGPVPGGSLNNGTANDGAASYGFVASDGGLARLTLSHSLAQQVVVRSADSLQPGTASNSITITFSDNAFVWAEDINNKIAGSNVVVAGRDHDLQVSLIKKDPGTGSCGIATDYSGTRNLKLWRSDSGGPWPAPGIVSPALASVPGSRPAVNNLNALSFTAGVAQLTLTSSDIGKFALNLEDDSLSYAASTISGNTGDLTVRPFTLVISAITQGAASNPGSTTASGTVFAKAGSNFSATVGAYRWSAGADSNSDGVPDVGATLAQVTAGGLTASYNTALTLSPLAASQTPAAGTLGTLNNGSVSGFVGGSKTVSTLQYTEVGSFRLVTTGLVSNYLGTASLNLDALVFNSIGAQSTMVGRFTPAWFTVVAGTQKLRSDLSCIPASSFNYLDEDFEQGLTLTAQNALGNTTKNYDDTLGFARLALSTGSVWQLTGIAGSTRFLSVGSPIRLSMASTGSWSLGVSSGAKLSVRALRNPVTGTPDGPFTLKLGIAPQDQDGITMASYDLDTDSPADAVNDRSLIATIPLLFGRLRLQNAIGSQGRNLIMTMQAESWNGANFAPNTLDSCTSIANAQLNFGNLRKSVIAADARLVTSPVTVSSGSARLTLAAPGGGRNGSYDVAVNLGDTVGDASCWTPGWTPNPAASSAAKMSYLRGNWCSSGGSSYSKDPSARATFGLYGSNSSLVYQRENF